jgi:hypothetical protein
MAKRCWGEDSDLLRLNVSRQPIEAGPKPGLSVLVMSLLSLLGQASRRQQNRSAEKQCVAEKV